MLQPRPEKPTASAPIYLIVERAHKRFTLLSQSSMCLGTACSQHEPFVHNQIGKRVRNALNVLRRVCLVTSTKRGTTHRLKCRTLTLCSQCHHHHRRHRRRLKAPRNGGCEAAGRHRQYRIYAFDFKWGRDLSTFGVCPVPFEIYEAVEPYLVVDLFRRAKGLIAPQTLLLPARTSTVMVIG